MVVEFGGGGVHWSWRFGRGGKGFLLGRVTKKGILGILEVHQAKNGYTK